MIYLEENWKNQIFPIFFVKIDGDHLSSSAFSQIFDKKFQNWVYQCFGGVLKLKVTKGELIISNDLEMAEDYLLGGGSRGPLPFLC